MNSERNNGFKTINIDDQNQDLKRNIVKLPSIKDDRVASKLCRYTAESVTSLEPTFIDKQEELESLFERAIGTLGPIVIIPPRKLRDLQIFVSRLDQPQPISNFRWKCNDDIDSIQF